MRVVGVRELKARLSEYLRDVRRGEAFLVTDRNRVVAELRPPGTSTSAGPDDVAARLQRLAEDGIVQPPRVSRNDWTWQPTGAGLPAERVTELLDRGREERGP
jgi:antitoxin (DNA-binding transcriptional repressor) of toxin-antitoxin stability system